ncbi:MAG: hypothetical protein DMF50_04220 [Acidobacteria bacterium]|nr:MAG: hypothetical protein DMF50_04220 [Acidobacteriota bacterium]
MKLVRAREPFRFFTRLCLTRLTGLKARNLRELLDHLEAAPDTVIYQHTHRFLRQHQYLVPEPPNDFAYWVGNVLVDERLAERLAAIDTLRFSSLEELKRALIGAIGAHLEQHAKGRDVPEGKEFHFMEAIRFSLPTWYEAQDLAGFAGCLRRVGISSLYLHLFEALLSPPLGLNDFATWLVTQLDEKALARRVSGLDPYTHTLEGLRSALVGMVERRLEEISRADS